MDENDLLSKVKSLQNEYYKENQKKTFFKKAQKYDCAKTVSTNMDVIKLLESTMYFIPNSRNLYIFIIHYLKHLLILKTSKQ